MKLTIENKITRQISEALNNVPETHNEFFGDSDGSDFEVEYSEQKDIILAPGGALVAQVDTHTLTGTSGTANIDIGGTLYLATFAISLAQTVTDFIGSHAAGILSAKGVVVTGSGEDVILTANAPGVSFASVAGATVTGDLASTLVLTTASVSFSCNVFDFVKIDKSKCTFLHIQCHEVVESPSDIPAPVRFQLSIDAVALGKMSQYQSANMSGFDSAMLIDSILLPDGTVAGTKKTVVLSVIVGSKN